MSERAKSEPERQEHSRTEVAEEIGDTALSEGTERRQKLGDDVDAMLDEIDEVLEENAEEFVRGYVQQGGQ